MPKRIASLAVALLVLGTIGRASAAELTGTIVSVNADAKTMVVQPAKGEKVTVTLGEKTEFLSEKFKAIKDFSFDKLKRKREVVVTHENGAASKVVLKKGKAKAAEAEPAKTETTTKAKKKKKKD